MGALSARVKRLYESLRTSREHLEAEDEERSASRRVSLKKKKKAREFLELSVVDELMSAHTKESLDSLNQLASNMRTSFSEYGSFMDEDQQFHAALLSPVSNALMRELAGAMWQVYAQLIDICEIPITVDAERTIKNHESIVRALRNKDSAAYREAVQNHYAPLRAAIAQL
mgnify:CR=1 FL=1